MRLSALLLFLSIGFGLAGEHQEIIVGAYISARYKTLLSPTDFKESDGLKMKSALARIDSLDEMERHEVYTLLFVYFDHDGIFAQNLLEVVRRNQDGAGWSEYLQKRKGNIELKIGRKNFSNLVSLLKARPKGEKITTP